MQAEGGAYFFVVALASLRASTLEDHINVLRDACRMVQQTRPVNIDAMIILPDDLDDVRSLAEGDADCSTRWNKIGRLVGNLIRHPGTCRDLVM